MNKQLFLIDDNASLRQPEFEIEEWKPIANYPGYEASSLGRFRSDLHVISGTLSHNGYVHIGFTKNKKQVMHLAHRVVAQVFLRVPSKEHVVVNHKDGNRSNNKIANLEWSTRSWNSKHAHISKRKKLEKLTHNKCREISVSEIVILGCRVLPSGLVPMV